MAGSAVGIILGVILPLLFGLIVVGIWYKRKEIKQWYDNLMRTQEIYQQTQEREFNRGQSHVYNEEFRLISQMDIQLSCTVAKHPQNLPKNRYRDTIPYDINRIILMNSKNGDYINASRIGGLFIATQDPLPDQDEDFWLMLWQNNVSIIIRLSSYSAEFPMAQYMPDIENDTWVFGSEEIKVTTLSLHHLGDIKIANLRVEKGGVIQRVVAYHLTSWRVGYIPAVSDVLQLVTSAQVTREKLGGLVAVHCGAGSGRTGTIIALWQLTDVIQRGQEPNVFKTVSDLRYERPGMVQTQDQYSFLYKCIKKYNTRPRQFWEGKDVLLHN